MPLPIHIDHAGVRQLAGIVPRAGASPGGRRLRQDAWWGLLEETECKRRVVITMFKPSLLLFSDDIRNINTTFCLLRLT